MRNLYLLLIALLVACSAHHPRRNPTGESFPDVQGTSLEGRAYDLPTDLRGATALLLVGFEQEAQFDIDRWLLGLRQAHVPVRVYELPTIRGLVPRALSRKIDGGMRSGIPREDWEAVITVYGDADKIGRFTGTENGVTARVLLLDASGDVRFFHDQGYSVTAVLTLKEIVASLAGMPADFEN